MQYRVYYSAVAEVGYLVEAENEEEARDVAGARLCPEICSQCSGWGRDYTLSLADDPACWEEVEVTEEEQ